MSKHAEDSVYALLSDGATIEIRAARPDDFDAVRDVHAKMSPDNLYLRFFSMSPLVAEQEARRICREPAPDHAALLAVLDGEVVGCGTYEQAGAGSGSAEVAFTVADDLHNRGIGMLLLTLPVVFPIIMKLGYDPVWFGIIIVKMVEIGLVTPPVGLNCFVVNGVRPDIPLSTVFAGVWPFVVADCLTIALLIAVPEIATYLPTNMGGG